MPEPGARKRARLEPEPEPSTSGEGPLREAAHARPAAAAARRQSVGHAPEAAQARRLATSTAAALPPSQPPSRRPSAIESLPPAFLPPKHLLPAAPKRERKSVTPWWVVS
jgi:hypothetical protein